MPQQAIEVILMRQLDSCLRLAQRARLTTEFMGVISAPFLILPARTRLVRSAYSVPRLWQTSFSLPAETGAGIVIWRQSTA